MNSGPSCVNGLAQELHLDSSTVTRQVGALESAGFVTRQVDPNDGRSWLIDLTPHGRKTMRTVERGRREAIDSMLGQWPSEEVDDLARGISRLNLALFDSMSRVSRPALAAPSTKIPVSPAEVRASTGHGTNANESPGA